MDEESKIRNLSQIPKKRRITDEESKIRNSSHPSKTKDAYGKKLKDVYR